jgi:hypothetical protein
VSLRNGSCFALKRTFFLAKLAHPTPCAFKMWRELLHFHRKGESSFCIDAKRRNLKQNENETNRKRNEKEAKLPSFSLQSEMKRNGSDFCSLRCKKVLENEMKRKKQKRSKNVKTKKDKVKLWDNL